MGMDAKGADMATYYLRDKIYSDKILAVVREYSCNALDEHKKHSIKKPVEIGIRKENDVDVFFVRDFAKGLSEDSIRNVFGMYFRSTKSGTNDQIGGFGIGSKAGHSYTDTFYVKSYYGGKCTLYACALGGGDSGIPVGHILKVSETSSSETGLEISLEIKKHETRNFALHCCDFVIHCFQPINWNYFGEVISPSTPFHSVEKNGFKFNFFHKPAADIQHITSFKSKCLEEVRIAMGDVTYMSGAFHTIFPVSRNSGSLKTGCQMVVEIPIGKMTLPISRENFEGTKGNDQVIESLKQTVLDLMDEDVSSIPLVNIEQLIKERDDHLLNGKMFQVYKKHRYSKVYPFVVHCSKTNEAFAPERINGKFVCAIIPNKMSADYWSNKFKAHVAAQGKNYFYANEAYINQCDQTELEKDFIFKKVKSSYFNWPKNEGGKSGKRQASFEDAYSVWGKWDYSYSWEKKNLNALQVHNRARNAMNLPLATSVEEAKKQMKSMNFSDSNVLNMFSFHTDNAGEAGDVRTFFRSKNLQECMLEIGWFDKASPEYISRIKEIREKEKEINQRNHIISAATLAFLEDNFKNKIREKFEKNYKAAKKFVVMFENIKNENSVRAKVIKSLFNCNGYWGSKVIISRADLRKILKMK